MNTNSEYILLGAGMVVFGIVNVIIQVKILRKGERDIMGYQKNTLLSSIGFIIIGTMIIVKNIS